jgi:hypothetical protein
MTSQEPTDSLTIDPRDVKELLARWASPEGHPYKGSLIDWDAYNGDGDAPPADIGCMCAQGQVLHLMGGWTPRRLKDIRQAEADLETAELLGISISHAILLRQVNDTVDGAPGIVLTEPEKVLGPNARAVLAIWLHFDAMTGDQWRDARDARAAWAAWAAWDARAARDAWDARAARAARAAWDARAARDAWDARDVSYCAVAEMAGIKFMPEHEAGEFAFLPMFGFTNPAEVIAAYPVILPGDRA